MNKFARSLPYFAILVAMLIGGMAGANLANSQYTSDVIACQAAATCIALANAGKLNSLVLTWMAGTALFGTLAWLIMTMHYHDDSRANSGDM